MSVEAELKTIFVNPRMETLEGVIAAGGKMNPELLILAYENGIFPWPHEGYPLLWFCPEERGVLDFADLHISGSFKKWMKKNYNDLTVTHNKSFLEVLRNCRLQYRPGQRGSWINNEIERNYNLLHQSGYAHSVEVRRDEKLVGGIYGVLSKKYFSAESMFFSESNCSKYAFYSLVEYLKTIGHKWMDIQMVTSVCENFGGKLISKTDFLDRIGK